MYNRAVILHGNHSRKQPDADNPNTFLVCCIVYLCCFLYEGLVLSLSQLALRPGNQLQLLHYMCVAYSPWTNLRHWRPAVNKAIGITNPYHIIALITSGGFAVCTRLCTYGISLNRTIWALYAGSAATEQASTLGIGLVTGMQCANNGVLTSWWLIGF